MPRNPLRRAPQRILALSIAAALAAGAGLTGAASASAGTPTFTVTGVVPSGVRTGVDVYALVWDDENYEGYWEEKSKPVKPDPTTGKFTLKLPAGSSRYTLYFDTDRVPYFDTVLGGGTEYPDDEKGKYVFTGKAGSVKKVGTIAFVAAGVIEGTIVGANKKPIVDAQVTAYLGAGGEDDESYFSTQTDKNGRYYLLVNRGLSYLLNAGDYKGESAYRETWSPGVPEEKNAQKIPVNQSNKFHAIASLTLLPRDPNITGSFDEKSMVVIDEYGDKNEWTPDVYLYEVVNGSISSIPYDVYDYGFDGEFNFSEIAPGDYRLAFHDPQTSAWLPWLSYSGEAGTPATKAQPNSCVLSVTVGIGHDANFGTVDIDTAAITSAATECGPPWGAAGTFSGTVTNMVKSDVIAEFYYVSDEALTKIDTAKLANSGNYSFDAVTDAGTYFVSFTPSEGSPFLDTMLGESDKNRISFDKAITLAPVLGAKGDSTGNDVRLREAAFLIGTVYRNGKPVPGADVHAHFFHDGDEEPGEEYEGDGIYGPYAETSSNGRFSLKVSQNTNYVLEAGSAVTEVQYFDHTASEKDAKVIRATKPGIVKDRFDFDLPSRKALITGFIIRMDLSNLKQPKAVAPFAQLSASLYRKSASSWTKVASAKASPYTFVSGNYFSFGGLTGIDLKSGDYRLRFKSGKTWIAIARSEIYEDYNDEYVSRTVAKPSCFLRLDDLGSGDQLSVFAAIDINDKKTHCTEEPDLPGKGASGGAATTVYEPIAAPDEDADAGAEVPTSTPSPFPSISTMPGVTSPDDSADEPAQAAPEAAVATVDLSWMLWTLLVLSVLAIAAVVSVLLIRRRA